MFQVICIDASNRKQDFAARLLKEGNTYSANQCDTFKDCYVLEEVVYDPIDGWEVSFKKDRFIPLSNIDETELINTKEVETVN